MIRSVFKTRSTNENAKNPKLDNDISNKKSNISTNNNDEYVDYEEIK
jgi:hypothetical protein